MTIAPDIKTRHRTMWALGDYPAVASQLIPELGQELVEACGIAPGQRVLDVAAGSGNAAVPAALAGADVVASDLTPELLERGRRQAEADGVQLTWEVADAEALPYDDAAFDTVMSCVGVMFAPNHQASADELVRVTKPGGTIGVLSWTPQGFIGQMFAAMRPYAPAPPPGAQPPPLWGDEGHVRGLLGDRVSDVEPIRATVVVDRFAIAAEFREYFKLCYGPTIAVYKSLEGQPERMAELDHALDDLARAHDRGDGSMEWEYLLLTAVRR
jgi:ubiquinone/menaquinone biosynthesis C-methylase UbiE